MFASGFLTEKASEYVHDNHCRLAVADCGRAQRMRAVSQPLEQVSLRAGVLLGFWLHLYQLGFCGCEQLYLSVDAGRQVSNSCYVVVLVWQRGLNLV